jgi:competence protein ComEA
MFILFTLYTNNKEKDKPIFEETGSNIILEETAEEFEKRLIYIHLAGNVGKPGLYEIEEGSRLNDLIIPGQISDMEILDKYFNRAQLLSDGEKIYIPFPEELDEVMEEPMFYTAQGEQGKVNFKIIDDIMMVKGIGTATFERIKELIKT